MERGFFHPARGYWQTLGEPSEDVRRSYPNGTVEVPVKPGPNTEFVGGVWVAVAQPAPAPATPQQLSFAQLLIGLVAEGWISEAEGEAWLEGRTPVAVQQLIATLPQSQRFAARARAARPSTVLRGDPLLNALAASKGKTPAQVDAFFTTYAAV